MSARAELKPCPFCGNKNVAQGASRGYISVWCFCGARGPEVPFPDDCIDPATPILECYELWNRRTPEPGTRVLRDGQPDDFTREQAVVIAEHFAQQWDNPQKDGTNDGFYACMQAAAAIRAMGEKL